MALPKLRAIKSTEIGNKTANINIKNSSYIHKVYNEGSKSAKNHNKVILLSIILTFWWCDRGYYHIFMIFAVFNLLLLTSWINCYFVFICVILQQRECSWLTAGMARVCLQFMSIPFCFTTVSFVSFGTECNFNSSSKLDEWPLFREVSTGKPLSQCRITTVSIVIISQFTTDLFILLVIFLVTCRSTFWPQLYNSWPLSHNCDGSTCTACG